MAATSTDQTFPPQKQDTKPGKEYTMDPLPQPISPHYIPSNKFHGKVVLVTGGDSGIGRAVCYHFAAEGATVAFTYVKGHEDKDALDTFQMLIQFREKYGSEHPMAIPVDLGFEENCKRVVDEVFNNFRKIDVLVNNAAEQHMNFSIEDISQEQLERVFRTNIFAYFFMAKHAVKHMKEGSSIINTTSVNAYKGNAIVLDYTATKGAIVSFTRALALELVNKGIRVNGVAPGPVWTPAQPDTYNEDMVTKFGKETPMGRAAQPHEIATCYIFLANQNYSSYFTGQVLHPNGGMIVNT
ncbi:hypothetical protein MKW98_009275 [Papaver atlanticum]|uniref:Secoisolariciresinol dehydrogenase n=1 Tax=Papaver atlanticum TaxID=357466 RepID=A0AAD4T0U5_9MAGN|nr:hypothetical protein MKW98_009275 [Papaver atlanticum]